MSDKERKHWTADGCPNCYNVGGFKKVLNLPLSDLDIYMHRETESVKPKKISVQKLAPTTGNDIYILHSSNPTELDKSVVVRELNMNTSKCLSCKAIIRRVECMLEEMKSIRRSDVYAICDHCRFTRGAKCKRCEYILLKFKTEQKQELDNQHRNFKQWLGKVKELLQSILSGGQLCKYGMYQKTADVVELGKLMEQLYITKDLRQPEIIAFPSISSIEELAQSKEMMREVIQKLRVEGTRRYSSDDSLYANPSKTYAGDCICKVFKDRAFSMKTSRELLIKQLSASKVILDKAMDKAQSKGLILQGFKRDETKHAGQNAPVEILVKEKKVQGKRSKADKNSKALKIITHDSLGQSTKKHEKNKPEMATKVVRTTQREAKVNTVTHAYQKQKLFEAASFENILECHDTTKSAQREMIRGMEVVPYDEDYLGIRDDFANALFFHSQQKFESKEFTSSPMLLPARAMSKSSVNSLVKSTKSLQSRKSLHDKVVADRSGVILYKLSDTKFIDNGWTQLPTTKTFRRMNIYKMLPAKSYNWFGRNKGTMYYGTREKLAEINEDGSGFWFYKNGLVALEYHDTPDSILMKRFTVFSHEVDNSKGPKSQNVLACFDYNGNGIVYDTKGNERLKYNQFEGYNYDSKVGAPGRWKWHALNDPPVYCQIYAEETLKNPSPELDELMKHDREELRRISNDAMLAIELQHIAKENAAKLTKKYKAFEIRMKTVRINDYFRLKVIDQANVYLLYRDGALAMKLNSGMILQNEIIATEEHDADVVTTPYDRSPPKPRYLDKEFPIAL